MIFCRHKVDQVVRLIISFFIFSLIFGGYVNTVSANELISQPIAVERNIFGGNTAPLAVPQTITVPGNATKSIILTGIDPDSPGLGFLIKGKPKNGRLDGWSKVTQGIEITYTPDNGWSGTDSFTFAVSDSEFTSAPAIVTLIVEGGELVERPPSSPGGNGNTAPLADPQTVTVALNTTRSITLTGTDPDSPGLGFSITGKPGHGRLDGWSKVAEGIKITYTPEENWSGTDSFTFAVSDSEKTAAPATVTLIVEGGELRPPGNPGGNAAPLADPQTVSVALNTTRSITLTGTDPDSPGLGFSITGKPGHGRLDGWSKVAEGIRISYTSEQNWTGTDSFTFTVSDSENTSAPATVLLNVGGGGDEENTAPVVKSSSETIKANTPDSIVLNGTDADGDPLTYEISRSPIQGTLSTVSGNKVTYTPKSGFKGKDNFTFRVSDGKSTSASATVTLTVVADNQAPIATSSTVSTGINSSVTVTLNATDAEGDTLTYEIVQSPSSGSVGTIAGNKVIYTPKSGFNGNDGFTFRAYDGQKYSSAATVSIGVSSNNQAPVAKTASVTTGVNVAFTLTLNGSDPDGDTLTYSIVSSPANGSVSSISGNKVTYTPKKGFTGNDSFTYRVHDGALFSKNTKVSITIAGQVEIDLSNATQLSKTGIAGDNQAIVATTTHAFIANSLGLVIFSKINSNPNKPIKVKTVSTAGFITSFKLSSDKQTLYMVDDVSGLQIVDVSVPENARIIGRVKTFYFPLDIAISSDEKYAYIADFTHVLVADISDHANPKIIGNLGLSEGNAKAIAISSDNKYAFVASGTAGLTVLDVSNPALPVYVSNVDTKGDAKGITLSLDDNMAYIADSNSGTVMMDISKPSNPFIRSVWNTSPPDNEVIPLNHFSSKIMSDGVTLIIAAGTGGLYSLDVSNPAKPVLTGSKDTPSFTFKFDLSADETRAIVMDFIFGLIVYDISK